MRRSSHGGITTYDELPIKGIAAKGKSSDTLKSSYIVEKSRLEPNFQSDAYKEQAKEIYKRRMHYNPREAASKSKERK